MRTIELNDATDSTELGAEIADILSDGGLVCVPCGGRYRIIADFENADAVIELMQAKGRVKSAPALVFVDGADALGRVTDDVHPKAWNLASKHWPGPLTIRVRPRGDLSPKVIKQLGGKKSRVGVRVPDDPLLRAIVERTRRPILVSSANRPKKAGDSSPAQVRKNFGRRVDLFVDGGDLKPEPSSTVIDIVDDAIVVERAGSIDVDTLAAE